MGIFKGSGIYNIGANGGGGEWEYMVLNTDYKDNVMFGGNFLVKDISINKAANIALVRFYWNGGGTYSDWMFKFLTYEINPGYFYAPFPIATKRTPPFSGPPIVTGEIGICTNRDVNGMIYNDKLFMTTPVDMSTVECYCEVFVPVKPK